jgi:energy-coupling factor transport system substrate-specific component
VPGHTGSLAFVAGDPLVENLQRFGLYTLLTSTGSFDTGRAITNSVAIIVLGPAVLTTLRRAARRATVTGVVVDHDAHRPPAAERPATRGAVPTR